MFWFGCPLAPNRRIYLRQTPRCSSSGEADRLASHLRTLSEVGVAFWRARWFELAAGVNPVELQVLSTAPFPQLKDSSLVPMFGMLAASLYRRSQSPEEGGDSEALRPKQRSTRSLPGAAGPQNSTDFSWAFDWLDVPRANRYGRRRVTPFRENARFTGSPSTRDYDFPEGISGSLMHPLSSVLFSSSASILDQGFSTRQSWLGTSSL
jgi:hypothetical protein